MASGTVTLELKGTEFVQSDTNQGPWEPMPKSGPTKQFVTAKVSMSAGGKQFIQTMTPVEADLTKKRKRRKAK